VAATRPGIVAVSGAFQARGTPSHDHVDALLPDPGLGLPHDGEQLLPERIRGAGFTERRARNDPVIVRPFVFGRHIGAVVPTDVLSGHLAHLCSVLGPPAAAAAAAATPTTRTVSPPPSLLSTATDTLASEDGSRAAQVSFGELDASRGMLALSHQNVQDLTPRNIFEARVQRASSDAYGFPATSHHSSISSASGREYPYYAASSVGSVDSSTDYSSAASDTGYDTATAARTLPRPGQLVGASLGPPAPQSMMGQFSSKVPSNTQKKHKCKVCDKRFTRPSSLQTHMYSHTGEKPFKCEVDGCGRHFSVVSNLRRHGKVHRGEASSEHSGDED